MSDMFSIHFLSDADINVSDATCCQEALGEIRIGEFQERFSVPIGYWDKNDYEQQWRAALHSLEHYDKVALMTAMTDPQTAEFHRFWALYRQNGEVIIQEHIYILRDHPEGFDPDRTQEFVPTRIADDDEPVSEWSTTMDELRQFLKAAS